MPLMGQPSFLTRPKEIKVTAADKAAHERKQQEEFDKLPFWKRALSDIPMGMGKGLLGLDPDDTGHVSPSNRSMMDNATLLGQTLGLAAPAFGITKYLKGGGVPNVAARQTATREFADRGVQLGMGAHAGDFASKYPRIAAHMDLDTLKDTRGPLARMSKTMKGEAETGTAFIDNPTKIKINIAPGMNDSDIRNTIAHEGTHVAQVLGYGPSDFNRLYGAANRAVGYTNNPFEVTAGHSGLRAEMGGRTLSASKGFGSPLNSKRLLAKVAAEPSTESLKIREILNHRKARGNAR